MTNYSLDFFGFRILTITLAVIAAFYLTSVFIKPKVLDNMCLTDTYKCVSIKYLKNKEGSILVHMIPTGYWWYYNKNVGKVYIYGEPTGRTCDKGEPTYVLDISKNEVVGYECVKKLDEIKVEFESGRENYIYHKPKEIEAIKGFGEVTRFNIIDCVNLFIQKSLI